MTTFVAVTVSPFAALRAAALVMACLGLLACQPESASVARTTGSPAVQVEAVPHPAPPDSALGSLLFADDSLIFSWVEQVDDESRLRFATRTDQDWGDTKTIAAGSDWFVNWADFPALAAAGETLYAHWLAREGEATYAYGVRISRSDDRGMTWSSPITPHADGTPTEHGFVSYLPGHDGRMTAVWLDGRNTVGGAHGDGGAMTLRAGILGDQGADEVELDDRACDCCQTDAARTSSGGVVVYRDRSDDETRDIAMVRWSDGQWEAPRIVAEDGWHIAACPVNGPAVAARDDTVVIAWFTMADDTPAVKLIRSSDGGATFSTPRRIDDGHPLGRVDLVLMEDGSGLLSWMELVEDAAVVRVAHVRGDRIEKADVGATSAARSSGFPRMATDGGRAWITWRYLDSEGARQQLAAITPVTPEQDGGMN